MRRREAVRRGAALGVAVLALLAGADAGAEPEPAWTPPAPSDSEHDWIQLTSGEWLRGELERLRDREIAFDSEELDDVTIDFSDVARFRLARAHSYRLVGRRVVRGSAELRDGVVKVQTVDGVVEFPRAELVGIVQGQGEERDRWSTKIGLGFSTRQGNTDSTELTASIEIRRETALTRLGLDYSGVISTLDDTTTANSHRAFAGFDFYVTPRFFLMVPFIEFFSDEFQNIGQRYTPGAGIGYELFRESWVQWEVTAGAAYQHTVFDSGGVASEVAALLGTEIDFDFETFDWDNQYRIQLVPTDFGQTSHHLESVLSFDIWGPLDLDVTFVWDRINSPEPDAGGVRPESDDVRLSVGLGLDF